jgi:hypothetical protein
MPATVARAYPRGNSIPTRSSGQTSPAKAPSVPNRPAAAVASAPGPEKKPPEILYQKYFKSAGPRTYAVQVSRARNDNQFITLIEGRRDPETNEVRKTRLLVFSEDYVEFFHLMHEVAVWVREHPLPEDFRERRRQYWSKKNKTGGQHPADNPRTGRKPAEPAHASAAD